MKRVLLKPVKSRKQLRKISFQKVLSAGFVDEDEKYFIITFATGNGTKQDLSIAFETRTPRIFISDTYNE